MRHPCYLEPAEFEFAVKVPWDRYRGDLASKAKLEEEAFAAHILHDEYMSRPGDLRQVPEWES